MSSLFYLLLVYSVSVLLAVLTFNKHLVVQHSNLHRRDRVAHDCSLLLDNSFRRHLWYCFSCIPSDKLIYHLRYDMRWQATWYLITLAGLGGSVGCAVRLETRRSRVQPPPRSVTFFRQDFLRHSLPSADSRRAVVRRKNVHNTG